MLLQSVQSIGQVNSIYLPFRNANIVSLGFSTANDSHCSNASFEEILKYSHIRTEWNDFTKLT